MSKQVDFKVVGVMIFLLIVIIISSSNWEFTSKQIFRVLESKKLTTGIWVSLVLFLIIHYYRNHDIGSETNNIVSEKEGLEKPIDYLQFLFTFGAIGLTIQTTTRELFAQMNFVELSKCRDFDGFDCFGFFAVILVLSFYSYNKIKPVVIEAVQPKQKVNRVPNSNE